MSEKSTRFRLDFAYDGTHFSGWAKQPGLRTVEGELEQVIAKVLRLSEPARLVVAGRTDTGVHATGQVAHVDIFRQVDPAQFAYKVNRALAREGDIAVRAVTQVSDDFDARFSALARRYEYRIVDSPAAVNPLTRHNTVYVPTPLDEQVMNGAAGQLLGLRDFATFCKPRPEATTIRELQEFEWTRLADGTLLAQLRADAFCHSMVRALIGACVATGSYKFDTNELVALRDAASRTSAFKVMPAHGLTLVEVLYPADEELADRAAQTRGRRDLGMAAE